MAEAMSCTELHNMAKAFALQNFPEVSGDKLAGPFHAVASATGPHGETVPEVKKADECKREMHCLSLEPKVGN